MSNSTIDLGLNSTAAQSLVKRLASYFYDGFLGFSMQDEDIRLMTWHAQEEFLNLTVYSTRVLKYPVNKSFSRFFLKKLLEQLQHTQEIHDGLYTSLCSVMASEAPDKFCYHHYVIDFDFNNVVTIKETKSMVVNGTTGLKTWEAALMLTDWALCNKQVFNHKKVVELGSGVGLTGITIAKLCGVASTILTDCHEEVLSTLCENIEINFGTTIKEANNIGVTYRNEETSIGVLHLNWNTIADLQVEVVPDVVIGADIIYDPSILQPLCNVLEVLCGRNSNLIIYIQSVIRNENTFQMFTELLGKMVFQYEVIEQERNVFLRWNTDTNRKLLKIIKSV